MKTIIIRALSGAVFITLIIGSLLFSKNTFALMLFVLNFIALKEFQQFGKNSRSNFILILGKFIFIFLHFIFTDIIAEKWAYVLLIIPILIGLNSLYSKDENENPINKISFSLLSLAYVSLPLVVLNYLNINSDGKFSILILLMFLIIWTNDTFAYLSGLAFGKHKLFERISPKKTWEGFIGGLFISFVAAYFLHRFVYDIQLIHWLILSLIIAISSVLGDFIESLFKRTAGLKDSGNIMPGHGGILDRIDSLLFVAPVMYIYIQLI